jgi:hypothetical protein
MPLRIYLIWINDRSFGIDNDPAISSFAICVSAPKKNESDSDTPNT